VLRNNVKPLLDKANMTRYELAKKCGFITATGRLMYTTVDAAISGKSVTVESALKIFHVLKVAEVCEQFEDVFFLDTNELNMPPSKQ
jgi:hypothetical protein